MQLEATARISCMATEVKNGYRQRRIKGIKISGIGYSDFIVCMQVTKKERNQSIKNLEQPEGFLVQGISNFDPWNPGSIVQLPPHIPKGEWRLQILI